MPMIAATNDKPVSTFATLSVDIKATIVQSDAGSDADDFHYPHPNQKSAFEKIVPQLGYAVV